LGLSGITLGYGWLITAGFDDALTLNGMKGSRIW